MGNTANRLNIGIFGGGFNPPHNGHLHCAQAALTQCGLDEMLFIPYVQPPHRLLPEDPGVDVRIALCQLALENQPQCSVCDIERKRGGTSYTIDTVNELCLRYPDAQLTLILGADAALQLPTWRDPETLLANVKLAIIPRDEVTEEQLATVLRTLHCQDWMLLNIAKQEVSSTLVRDQVAQGRSIAYLVPAAVEVEIKRRLLYSHS